MATFRVVPTGIWADDIFLSMSPEQKMIMLYLHTCPSATQCGIYKLPMKTMGFHLGFTHQPVENALKGLCSAFSDLVAYDEQTGEIALLQHPKNVLTNASPKIWKQIIGELQNVQSGFLLQKVMARNSATANAPYLNRYRQLHIESVNNARKDVKVIPDSKVCNIYDYQEVTGEIEKEREIEKKEKGITKKTSSISILEDADFRNELKEKFPNIGVDIQIDKAIDWIRANGRRYKNYAAFMRNWLRTEEQKRLERLQLQGKIYTPSTLDTTCPSSQTPRRNNMAL